MIVVSKKTRKKIFDLAEDWVIAPIILPEISPATNNTIGIIIHELNSNSSTSVLAG